MLKILEILKIFRSSFFRPCNSRYAKKFFRLNRRNTQGVIIFYSHLISPEVKRFVRNHVLSSTRYRQRYLLPQPVCFHLALPDAIRSMLKRCEKKKQ